MYTRKKRAISILVIATFLMSMIPTIVVSATLGDVTLDRQENGGAYGTAEWTAADQLSGSYSVLLGAPGESTFPCGAGHVRVDYASADLSTITDLGFWYNLKSGNPGTDENSMPYMILELVGNIYIVHEMVEISTHDTWLEWELADDATITDAQRYGKSNSWHVYSPGCPPDGDPYDLWANVEAVYGTTDVLMVKVAVGEWASGVLTEYYVDDICINDVTYDLEYSIPGAEFNIDYVSADVVDYGDILQIVGSGVTSGSDIEIFWDTAIGTGAQLLNTTEGNPDGSFDVEIKIPSDVVGNHYLWVVDVASATSESHGPLTMVSLIKLSPSAGLVGDEITVKGYGFAAEKDVDLTFNITDTAHYTELGTDETDELGYFEFDFDIPTAEYSPDHEIHAIDELANKDTEKLKVGTSIALTPDEGPTGTVVTVEGRGWTYQKTITFKIDGQAVEVVDKETVTVDSRGEFSAEIVIPGVADEDDYSIKAIESVDQYATEDFEVTGIPEIVVSPTYGAPGSTITVTGSNFTQIAGTDVVLTFVGHGDYDLKVTAETEADGTFEDTFTSPAILFETYDVTATDDVYHIVADDPFKVGLIAFIINPTYGESGTGVGVTGIGFANGDYNLTFGTKLYEDFGEVELEAMSDTFYVPNIEPGTYDLTVTDTDENELTVQYRVTESTYVVADPAMAPNDYNVSLKGYHFADAEGAVDFVIYNVTADGEVDKDWDMNVRQDGDPDGIPAETDTDGNFTAYWYVLDEDTMSLGDYTINVTGSKGLLVQVPFSVVTARVSVEPRKTEFDRGDTIQFDIKNDFKLPLAYIEIYNPSDILYWSTIEFDGKWWMLDKGLYTVPYYRQTDAAENPMELQSDAPMGTWFYVLYYKGDELINGTFKVGASTAAKVEEMLAEVYGSIDDLAEDVAGITDEIEDDIAALSGEIDDITADVQDMIDDITADIADDLAQVAEDTEAAVSDLEGAIGDIAGAQADLASELEDIGQDTAAAKDAAEDAQTGTQGLTTLVYGAIAASLIAALAAVVSLMQISKKIA